MQDEVRTSGVPGGTRARDGGRRDLPRTCGAPLEPWHHGASLQPGARLRGRQPWPLLPCLESHAVSGKAELLAALTRSAVTGVTRKES